MNDAITIKEIEPADSEWVSTFLMQHFGYTRVVSRGVMHHAMSCLVLLRSRTARRERFSRTLTDITSSRWSPYIPLCLAWDSAQGFSNRRASARLSWVAAGCSLSPQTTMSRRSGFMSDAVCALLPFIAAQSPNHASSNRRFRCLELGDGLSRMKLSLNCSYRTSEQGCFRNRTKCCSDGAAGAFDSRRFGPGCAL